MITMKDAQRGRRRRAGIEAAAEVREVWKGEKRERCSLEDGAWRGKRCFIVGGGPSLRGFDWSVLEGELTIGINRAFEFFEPAIILGMDRGFARECATGKYRMSFMASGARKLFVTVAKPPYPDGIETAPAFAPIDRLSPSIAKGLGHGGNAGFAALNLALCLGASEIFLLGFDMRAEGDEENWHDGYGKRAPSAAKFGEWIGAFKGVAEEAKKKARIVNVNRSSALRCFDFGNLPFAKRAMGRPETFAMTSELRDGMWEGRPCFVVGGGPSLKGFNWDNLKGELVIAVNRAFEYCDAAVSFTMDTRFLSWLRSGKLEEDAKRRYKEFAGLKVILKTRTVYDYPAGSYVLPYRGEETLKHRMTTTLVDGLGHGENSGFGAINLALNLGANPIYLLGFDMRDDEGELQAHHHDQYPTPNRTDLYPERRGYFEAAAAEIRGRARIVNLNQDSGLKCFAFGNLGDLPACDPPMFVSYYTEGTEYEEEARELVETLVRWGLEHDVQGRSVAGRWEAKCNYKAEFIAEMRAKHTGRRVVWLDADARVRRHPSLYKELDCDFGAFFLEGGDGRHGRKRTPLSNLAREGNGARPWLGGELISAALFFAPTQQADEVVERWRARNRERPEEWDQANLQSILPDCEADIVRLPVEYCSIFDHPRRSRRPVIEQFQASRRLKREANG